MFFIFFLGSASITAPLTVPSAVTMATPTGFSSCAALKNVKLTYNAVSLMGAAGPQRNSAAKSAARHILVNSFYSAVDTSPLKTVLKRSGLGHGHRRGWINKRPDTK